MKFGWTRTGRRLTRIFMLGALTIWSPSEAAACGYHDDVSIAAAIYAELVRILRHLANPTLSVANTSHRTENLVTALLPPFSKRLPAIQFCSGGKL